MTKLLEHLIAKTSPIAKKENIVERIGFRITVLTPSLIRVEVQKDNKFIDDATQSFWFRDLPAVDYTVEENDKEARIITEKATFCYSIGKKKITKVKIDGSFVTCNNKGNLLGTRRTLDFCIGAAKLENGLLSRTGVSVYLDDSLIIKDGKTEERPNKGKDYYIFAYGKDYRNCIKDFFKLTGEVPMLPRYVLGNWWSRYRAYSQQEYISLMERFQKESLPFTVATIDMDWHWVDVNKRFNDNFKGSNIANGPGWTGYSWNTELFPDYREFLNWLHNNNYHVTLNLHPALGIRWFEDCYNDMAKAMGVDPASKATIPFDLSDNKFINNYFEVVHRPFENEGVDFWWIDWQQGTKSTVKNLDPLWALNHYHYLDNCLGNKRGVILSRYSGFGSHRYPLGFSGDTVVYWRSLQFQPYFTNNASNVGYGWWSHDIGGHTFGINDDEMYLRWCQYGVFSPINRLHSTSHDLFGKEPWKRSAPVRAIVNDFLRLRHALVPYIYTMSYLTNKNGISLCEPMYYSYPEREESYTVPNQYTFGTELIVNPVVTKKDKRLNLAKTVVWLPEGRYTDIFTNKIYQGNRYVTMFRDWDTIPVLAKEGAIIPMSMDEGNKADNPKNMKLKIYRGNNSFELYEDDGYTNDYQSGKFVTTKYTVKEEGNKVTFIISAAKGDTSLIPEVRNYNFNFADIVNGKIKINGKVANFNQNMSAEVNSNEEIIIEITDCEYLTNGDIMENAKAILSRYNASNLGRILKYFGMGKIKDSDEFYQRIQKSRFPKNVKLAVKEAMDK